MNRSVAPEGNLVVNALETKKGEGKIKRKKKSGRDDEILLIGDYGYTREKRVECLTRTGGRSSHRR